VETSWYLARPKSPRQQQFEVRLAGMDAGEYVAECRAQGMAWADIARLLTEDTGIWMNPGAAASPLSNWLWRWEATQQAAAS